MWCFHWKITDTSTKFISVYSEQDETKKIVDEELPKHSQNLEILGKLYGDSVRSFVDNHLTWADFYFHAILDYFLELDSDCLNNYACLKQNQLQNILKIDHKLVDICIDSFFVVVLMKFLKIYY